MPGPSSPCPANHFANHGREEDRATYHGTIDNVDAPEVRSAVGLCWRAYLGYWDGRCQCGYLPALPPTAARTLRNHGIINRRVREAVLGLIAWTVIAYPCPLFRKHRREGDHETYRERLGTLTAPRYVPRSVFVGERTSIIEVVDTNAVTSSRYPRPLHEPYGTTGSSIVGFVKRSLYLLTGPSSIIHTHHFANINGKRTAARTLRHLKT
jgi:hypothetical protein